MTPALEARIIAYAILALGVIGLTAYATHKLEAARYERLDADFAKYRSQTSEDYAAAHKAARDALQAQIAEHAAAEARNAQISASLESAQAEAAAAHRDAEFARRLLATASNSGTAASGDPVPEAGGGSGSHDSPSTSGDRPTSELSGLIADSASECRIAIQKLTALQLEVSPQL